MFTCHGRLWPYHGELERTALGGDIPCTGQECRFYEAISLFQCFNLTPKPRSKADRDADDELRR